MTFRHLQASLPGLLVLFLLLGMVGCDDKEEKEEPPVLITKAAEEITSSSALTGGIILDQGSHLITRRGVVYSRAERYPVLADHDYTEYQGDQEDFPVLLEELSGNSIYFIRAYAKNEAGVISYGASLSFTTK